MADEGVELVSDAVLGEFIGRWNLQEDAQNLLLTMDPAKQLKVIQEFAPRDESRDANGIFLKFARGIASGVPQGPRHCKAEEAAAEDEGEALAEIESFASTWSLGAEAQALLMGLPPAVRQKVMQEFAPRDTTRDANIIFIKFAQGVAGKGKGGGKGFGKMQHQQQRQQQQHHLLQQYLQQQQYMQQQQQQQVFHGAPFPVNKPRFAVPVAPSMNGVPSVEEFVAKWSLDATSQSILYSLDAHQQARVLQEFRPRDASRDVNAIFTKFATGIAENRARGGAINVVRAYLDRWQMSPDAQQLFFQLRPDLQNRIMQEFSPRDTSRDVSNIFMKFCQGVARADGGGVLEAQVGVAKGGKKGGGKGCFVCGGDHLARECPQVAGGKGGGKAGGKGCFVCGGGDHLARDCPEGKGARAGPY